VLLRKVDKRRWDWLPGTTDWVPSGDIPAAPVADFKTSLDSKISVWHIESDNSNLERIIAGMAANCQNPDKFDYVVFPEAVLDEAGVAMETSAGDLPDKDANAKWHRDLVKISAMKLSTLVALIHQRGNVARYLEDDVIGLIRKFSDAGFIEKKRLQAGLAKYILGK
jgi:hypothetical protein